MTLRILGVMARSRSEMEGWYGANIIRHMPFSSPTQKSLNPFREEDKSQEMIELERWQAKRRWAVLFGTKKKRLAGD